MIKPIKRNFIAEQIKELEQEQKQLQIELKLKNATNDERFNILYFEEKIVTPKKYIWHLSYKKNRQSILNNGIKVMKRNYAVFANNMSLTQENITRFWPIPIDRFDFENGMPEVNELFTYYDFWKIDTTKLDHIWRVDPKLRQDLKGYRLRSVYDYVCSKKDIPANVIELGQLNEIRY